MAQVKTICIEALERHCASGETGRLDLQRSEVEGQIFTKDHLIVHATLAGLEGIPALFRLFDWGDADVIWNPGVETDSRSLNIDADTAGVMYAEHLRDRASLEKQEQEKLDAAFATTSLVSSLESVLKYYTIRLECVESSLLPGGFTFTDSNKNSYVIGSSDSCDVVLRHPSVDPLHCGIILESGSVFVWDLGSQSGIKLNGVPTSEGKLKVGDVMTLGAVDLRVKFQIKRPEIRRPATTILPRVTPPPQSTAPPSNVVPKGPITFEKVNKQMRGDGGGLFSKIGSLFKGRTEEKKSAVKLPEVKGPEPTPPEPNPPEEKKDENK